MSEWLLHPFCPCYIFRPTKHGVDKELLKKNKKVILVETVRSSNAFSLGLR